MKIINEIDLNKNYVTNDNFSKFLGEIDYTYLDRSKPKGPDYLVVDDFLNLVALNKLDLLSARTEAEYLSNGYC